MGRPSVQAQRKREILEAFETCVTSYGIEGATLERIAEESGLARPLIRHHAGNRDELIASLFERFLQRSADEVASLIGDLPDTNASATLLDRLFDHEGDQKSVLLAEAFIACSAFDSDISEAMTQWVRAFIETIADVLRADFPEAEKNEVQAVAVGIVGIHFNLTSLSPFLELPELAGESKGACERLLSSLRTEF